MLKELLLQKGMSEAEADEIVAANAAQTEDSSLIALQKALDNDSMDELFKAKGGGKGEPDEDDDEGDDDEEYDEKFMKKHKKYMKKIGKEKEGHEEPDGDEGMFGKMKKAIDDIDPNAEGAIVEMAELAPVLDAVVETMQSLAKAISGIKSEMKVISAQNEASYSLMAKAAAVQVETAETISGIASTPSGRKGILIQDMAKAKTSQIISSSPKEVWTVLSKAIHAGDTKAGMIGSKFESSGMKINFLNQEEQKYVADLIAKEAN